MNVTIKATINNCSGGMPSNIRNFLLEGMRNGMSPHLLKILANKLQS